MGVAYRTVEVIAICCGSPRHEMDGLGSYFVTPFGFCTPIQPSAPPKVVSDPIPTSFTVSARCVHGIDPVRIP